MERVSASRRFALDRPRGASARPPRRAAPTRSTTIDAFVAFATFSCNTALALDRPWPPDSRNNRTRSADVGSFCAPGRRERSGQGRRQGAHGASSSTGEAAPLPPLTGGDPNTPLPPPAGVVALAPDQPLQRLGADVPGPVAKFGKRRSRERDLGEWRQPLVDEALLLRGGGQGRVPTGEGWADDSVCIIP